ncbi:DUF7144 family membrane protein [Streptomyces meridianus]|uniref:DUF7144 domain-containing protein n=1 Tax=Streptomyces meridianus TaxID=2938945 RepID=A0ABT0XDK4_9ACTN|nr:hypothetical protein [Streptomyces meridianus]MCM2579797.1 hypothetical protein [Streptomyces meridianus]
MSTASRRRAAHPGPMATGLVTFAGVMLILAGALDVISGLMAVAKDDIFVTTPNYTFAFDLQSWGWIHLVLGALAVLIGVSLFKERFWARIAGVVVAGLLLLSGFLTIPSYPLWSIVLIALYGFVIWALCSVGGRG